jgi:hypothetical protein
VADEGGRGVERREEERAAPEHHSLTPVAIALVLVDLSPFAYRRFVEADFAQDLRGQAIGDARQGEQQVLGAGVRAAVCLGFPDGELERFL